MNSNRRAIRTWFVVAAIASGAACDSPTRPGGKSLESCLLDVRPSLFSPCMAQPLETTVDVVAQKGCTWNAATRSPWVQLLPSSGEGPGELRILVTENWDLPRSGWIDVRSSFSADTTRIAIFQAGCFYWASTDLFDIAPAGGSGSFMVLQSSDPLLCGGPAQNTCRWQPTADVGWIDVANPVIRTGDGSVSFTVHPNTTGAAREGRIRIYSTVIVVRQTG
jgi:hypothetical protein